MVEASLSKSHGRLVWVLLFVTCTIWACGVLLGNGDKLIYGYVFLKAWQELREWPLLRQNWHILRYGRLIVESCCGFEEIKCDQVEVSIDMVAVWIKRVIRDWWGWQTVVLAMQERWPKILRKCFRSLLLPYQL